MHYIKETNHLNELCYKLNKSEFLSIDRIYKRKNILAEIMSYSGFNGRKIIIDPLAKLI